jgi:hypothetical protein
MMFDNDDPIQRGHLIRALAAASLGAREFNSGGGIMHVAIAVLNTSVEPPIISAQDPNLRTRLQRTIKTWPHESTLYIATNSLRINCEIGLVGNDGRTGNQVASTEWKYVDSIEEAVSIFQQLWSERDKWLGDFIEGKLAM